MGQAEKQALVREVLERVGDKWTLIVIEELGENRRLRFTQLLKAVGGISQKMLTRTVRQLERDGLVQRLVFPVVPPHTEYELTAMGRELGEAVCGIWTWVERHAGDVHRARHVYDAQAAARAGARPRSRTASRAGRPRPA